MTSAPLGTFTSFFWAHKANTMWIPVDQKQKDLSGLFLSPKTTPKNCHTDFAPPVQPGFDDDPDVGLAPASWPRLEWFQWLFCWSLLPHFPGLNVAMFQAHPKPFYWTPSPQSLENSSLGLFGGIIKPGPGPHGIICTQKKNAKDHRLPCCSWMWHKVFCPQKWRNCEAQSWWFLIFPSAEVANK